jgi:ABC-2 type transport system ATP-binding protein
VHSAQPIRVTPLVRFFEDHEVDVAEARKIQPSLEEVFVEVTGIELDRMRREKEKRGADA